MHSRFNDEQSAFKVLRTLRRLKELLDEILIPKRP